MATLVKHHNWYYVQFYDRNRTPQRKRIPLKTRTKQVAEKLQRQLENKYALGEYDPWTGFQKSSSELPVNEYSTLAEVLDYFITKKSREDWRENTAVNTSYVLKAFARFVGEDKSVKALTTQQVNKFLNQERYAYETKKTHKAKILGFINWVCQKGILNEDFAEVKIYNRDDEQDESISYVSPNEIKTLKETIQSKVKEDIKKGYQKRDRNALWLIDFIDWQRYSGMRISETLNLYPSDINTESWEVRIGSDKFSTKVKSKQVLPIGQVDILKKITNKLLENSDANDQRLFKHKDRRRTSRTFKKYVKIALPHREDITVHTLRHTCCIELLRKGVPIYTVQRWMRHSSVRTTQRYADLLASDISERVGLAFNNIE